LEFTLINGDTGYSVSKGTATVAEVVIPSVYNGLPVTAIEVNGFQNYSAMTSVIIPNSVTTIGYCAFSGCNSLESITIPFVGNTLNGTSNTSFGYIFGSNSSVPPSLKAVIITGGGSIAYGAFYGCSGLTSVTIGDGVTSIGESAFYGCSGLTSVIIPGNVTAIGDSAFRDCTGFAGITIPFVGNALNGTSNTHFGYIFGASSDSANNDFIPPSLKTVIVTGSGSIGNLAFYNCSGLTGITIPDSVTSIGLYAFYNCSGLTNITIPDSVTNIDDRAFFNCKGLTSVIIPDSVTNIGESTFFGCIGLTSVTIPDSVKGIGNNAFFFCSNLTRVFYKGADSTAWSGITIGTNNTYLTNATRYYHSATEPASNAAMPGTKI
jgi:hypothetical protein